MEGIKTMKYLGIDKHGFTYYMGTDNYVYQKYPDKDYFVIKSAFCSKCNRAHTIKINKRAHFNGWFCSGPAWERTFKRKLSLCPNTVFHQNVEDGIETNHDQCAHCKTLKPGKELRQWNILNTQQNTKWKRPSV